MTMTTTLSEPRWTPKCTDDREGDGYWEVDLFQEFVPSRRGRIFGQRPSSGKWTYAYLSFACDHVSRLGWINTSTRRELSMHTDLARKLEDRVKAFLREEEFAKIHKAAIERAAR